MKYRTGMLLKRGGNYYCRWVVNGKAFQRSLRDEAGRPITTKADAETARVKFMAAFRVADEATALQSVVSQLDGKRTELVRLDEERNPPLLVANAWKEFERSSVRPDAGERTLSQYESEYDRFAAWLAKHHKSVIAMRAVTPDIAQAYAHDLTTAQVAASTYNQHIQFLRMLWRTLAGKAKTTENPWTGITPRKLQKLAHRKRALTAPQFDALLAAAAADPDMRDLLLVLAWTGLRLVDGVKLRWQNVDFSKNVLSLYPQKTAGRTGKEVHIPIFPQLLEVLERRHSALPVMNPGAFVFPEVARMYDRDNGSSLSNRIGAIFLKAGMQAAETRAGLGRAVVLYGAHSLRHFFVTTASEAGMPAAMIKSITGHSSDGMLEHYQHIGAEIAGEFAKRLSSAKAAPGTLPAADPVVTLKASVRELAAKMTAKTWKGVRAELLALTGEA